MQLALTAVLGMALAAPPAPLLLAEPTEAELEEAKAAYEEGRLAYKKGRMGDAVLSFERAYDLTENPIILYNLGLAYRRQYDEERDIAQLRRARVVLENFALEVEANPSLGDIEEVRQLLDDILEQLESDDPTMQAEGSAADGTEGAASTGADGGNAAEARPEKDPGKVLRFAGIGGLAGGGALTIGTVVAGVVIKGKYDDEISALNASVAEAEAAGCSSGDSSGVCGDYESQREALTLRANLQRTAMIRTTVSLGVGSAVLLGAGTALFLIGRKRSKAWSEGASATWRLRPQIGPGQQGLVLEGRF